jgi:hypothetical protein
MIVPEQHRSKTPAIPVVPVTIRIPAVLHHRISQHAAEMSLKRDKRVSQNKLIVSALIWAFAPEWLKSSERMES